MRGYTRFTQEHGDEAAARLVAKFAGLLREIVDARGGRLVELRGDEALVAFGSARQALRAAVELQDRFGAETEADPTLPLPVGIGLDAGEAVPLEGGYRGEALNLAARLCNLAGPGEVLASEGVVYLGRRVDGLAYAERGLVPLKGFVDPVHVIRVVPAGGDGALAGGATSDLPRPQMALPIGGFLGALPSGVMVGRADEWDRIMASVEGVTAGRGQLVLLSGEPGIGKTRLAQEVTLKVRNRGFLVGTGRCYEQEQGVPFYPFLEALSTLYNAAPAGLRVEVPQRWPHLVRLLPDQIDPLQVVGVDGQEDQQRLFRAVTQFVEAMALVTPLALLLDDLHCADDSTLKLLQHLARYTRASRVLLLGTYRDVEVQRQHPLEGALLELGREGLVEEIEVRRLDSDGTADLVREILGHEEDLQGLAKLVYQRTEGNAFFVQEMLRALVERGDLYHHNGHWERRRLEEMEVPKSIRAVIGQRLSRLPTHTQEILHEASVLGQAFTFDDVFALGNAIAAGSGRDDDPWTEDEVDAALAEAAAAGLIRETGPDAYAFNHALTQQTLYSELSTRRKKRLHLAAGTVLENQTKRGGGNGRWAELAWHFVEGDDAERALLYALLAGDAAEDVFAHGEAERQYRTAVELAHDLHDGFREAEAREKLAGVLTLGGRYDDALDLLDQAMRLHHSAGDLEGEACAAAQMGNVHYMRGTPDEAIARLRPMVETLEADVSKGGPSYGLAALYGALARLYDDKGWHSKQLDAATRAADLAHQIGDARLLAGAEITHSDALWNLGEDDDALRVLEDLIPRTEASGDLHNLGRALANAASYYARRGDFMKDRLYFERMLAVAERRGDRGQIVLGVIALSGNAYLTGDWERSSAYLDRAESILSHLTTTRVSGWPTGARAWLELRKGNLELAAKLAEETSAFAQIADDLDWQRLARRVSAEKDILEGRPDRALARLTPLLSAGKPEHDAGFMRTLARAYLENGDMEAAEQASEKAVAQATAGKDQPELVECLAVQAAILTQQSRWQEAQQILDYALAGARRMPFPLGEALALRERGLMRMAQGDASAARQDLESAGAIFSRLGARLEAERVEALVSEAGPHAASR